MLRSRLIEDRSKAFLLNGSAVIESISVAFANSIVEAEQDSIESSSKSIADIICYYLQGDIEITAILEMVKAADLNNNQVAASLVTDVIWMLGTQLSQDEKAASDETKSAQWTSLCNLVRSIHAESLIPSDSLKLSLEFNLLCGAGVVKDEAAIRSKLIKCNTQLMYRQQKYNLLREESEGYSKLFTLLCSVPTPPHDPANHIKYLTSVIGYFDLDPNRVVDVVLDAFEQQLWNISFIEVLNVFKRASIVHILGFKFTRYHVVPVEAPVAVDKTAPIGKDKGKAASAVPASADASPQAEPAPKAPHSLYSLAGVLIAHGLVTLSELIPYFNPNASETGAACEAETARQIAELKQYGVVSLSAKSVDTPTAASTTASIATGLPRAREYADGNQQFGMLAALYELKLLSAASELERSLFAGGCTLASSFCDEVRDALIGLIMWRTDPVYTPLSFLQFKLSAPPAAPCGTDNVLPNLPGQCHQVHQISSFFDEVAPMLHTLGHHLGTSPELFTRTCRILESIVKRHCGNAAEDAMEIDTECVSVIQAPLPSQFILLITQVMFPSLTRSKSVAAPCAQLLWSVLKPLPFQTRFSLYQEWKGSGLGKDGLRAIDRDKKDVIVLFAEAKVLNYAKAQLKRLSKDNVKQMSRSLSNATHSCPLISYTHILNSIQVFDNLIPFVVDALKYTTDLSRDVMAYALIVQLQKDSEKLKPGDTHYTQWFASLAKFIATFYRKYPATCLEGLLHFLVGSLSKGESLDLLVLRELLTKMGACETMLDLSHSQLEGLAIFLLLKLHNFDLLIACIMKACPVAKRYKLKQWVVS